MLPVSVLIPTRDAMAFLPGHLETMREWLNLAEEIIVVDSESCDGTPELLKRKLTGPKIRFFNHPPGLYQSWNFGIQQARSQYIYISTVGDQISREGLIHLVETANKLSSDVVVSPPAFINSTGRKVRANPWPVHQLISDLQIRHPICLAPPLPFFFALTFSPIAILGSSASNLYRTATLQRHLFPVDFGTHGDGAWGFINGLKVRLGVTPKIFSCFRKHLKSYSVTGNALSNFEPAMLESAFQAAARARTEPAELLAQAQAFGLDRFLQRASLIHQWRQQFQRQRRQPWPWVLNPSAWRTRQKRLRMQGELRSLLSTLLQTNAPESQSSAKVPPTMLGFV